MNKLISSSIILMLLFCQEVISNPIHSPPDNEPMYVPNNMVDVFECLIMHHISHLRDEIYIKYGDIDDPAECSQKFAFQIGNFQAKVHEYANNCLTKYEGGSNPQLSQSDETKSNCSIGTVNDCSQEQKSMKLSSRKAMDDCLRSSWTQLFNTAIKVADEITPCIKKTRTPKIPATEEINDIRKNQKNENYCPI